jgi:hypothetical protein
MFHCNNKRKRRPYIEKKNCTWKLHWLTRPRRTSVYQTEDMRLEPETSEEGPAERAGSVDLAFQTTAWGVRVIKPVRCFFVWQLQPLTNARYYFLLYRTLLLFVRGILFRHNRTCPWIFSYSSFGHHSLLVATVSDIRKLIINMTIANYSSCYQLLNVPLTWLVDRYGICH